MFLRSIFIFLIFVNTAFALDVDFLQDFVNIFPTQKGYVIKVEDGNILLDMGKKDSLFPGLTVSIYKTEKKIIHPITNEVIAETTQKIGRAVIRDVYENFSTGSLIDGEGINISNYVTVDYPIPVNIEYYQIEDYLKKDIEQLIKHSNKFEVDKTSPFTLRFYKSDEYGLTFEFSHFGNILVSQYVSDLKVRKRENKNEVVMQDFDSKGYFHIAICQVENSESKFGVLAEDDSVDIYKIINDKFEYYKTIDAKFKNIISVDCADLNQNGKEEIFISVSNKGNSAKTYIYELKDGKFSLLSDSLPFVTRSVFINGTKKMVAQRIMRDGRFIGNINFLDYTNEYFKGEDIPNTKGFSIYGFGLGDVDNNKVMDIIRVNDKSYLEIYGIDGKLIYRSKELYADSRNYFVMKEIFTDKFSNKEDVDKLNELKSRVYIRDRIFTDKHGKILTGKITKSDNVVPTFEKYFNKTFTINAFENSMLKNIWTSQELGEDVNDFYISFVGDKVKIYAIKGEKGGIFNSSKSRIITLEFNDYEK